MAASAKLLLLVAMGAPVDSWRLIAFSYLFSCWLDFIDGHVQPQCAASPAVPHQTASRIFPHCNSPMSPRRAMGDSLIWSGFEYRIS